MGDERGEDDGESYAQADAGKVYIVPTLQMNLIKYREDENTFLLMLKKLIAANQNSRLKLATGYLNL